MSKLSIRFRDTYYTPIFLGIGCTLVYLYVQEFKLIFFFYFKNTLRKYNIVRQWHKPDEIHMR